MGAGLREAEPDVGCCPVSTGDRFLLCTDGVIDGLWDRHLDELVRDEATLPAGQSLAQRIVLEAVEKSGRDNATALVFDFRGAPPSSGVTPT
jgi:protein phosphatase